MSELNIISQPSLDLKKWDKVVLSSSFPLVFAQSFYLNATAPNWKALIVDNYKAVMPLTQASKLKINYLFQPPFTSQLGVYGEISKKQTENVEKLIENTYKFIEIELNAHCVFARHTKNKATYTIEFKKGYKFNENSKRNIAKANKLKYKIVDLEFNRGLKLAHTHIIPWLKKDHKIPETHCKLLLKLLSNANENNSLKTFVTMDGEGIPQAIGYFVYNHFHAVFLKGMTFNKKDNTGSMHALMDHAIKFFENKVQLFDFGGGSSPGLATFYKGLGGKELKYQVYKINNLPWPLKVIKK